VVHRRSSSNAKRSWNQSLRSGRQPPTVEEPRPCYRISGCRPSTPSSTCVRRSSSSAETTTQLGSSSNTGSDHPMPSARISFPPPLSPHRLHSGVSTTASGTAQR
jgi:hypothetical protein